MFKKIEINIPFSEELTQMPHYAKFMKDIFSRKRKIVEEGVVSLITTCNAVIQKSNQRKCRIQAASLYLAKLGILIWEKHYAILELALT